MMTQHLPPPDSLLDYYRRAPWATLVCAMDLWGARPKGQAIDLGCGSGNDTLQLLRSSWRVLAIDKDAEVIEVLRKHPLLPNPELLEIGVVSFEDVAESGELPEADLINASLSLPFCDRAKFPAFWKLIGQKLRLGGLFAGNLFGPNDGWAEDITHFEASAARSLFSGFDVMAWEEKEFDADTMEGKRKHWHIFDIVARKSEKPIKS